MIARRAVASSPLLRHRRCISREERLHGCGIGAASIMWADVLRGTADEIPVQIFFCRCLGACLPPFGGFLQKVRKLSLLRMHEEDLHLRRAMVLGICQHGSLGRQVLGQYDRGQIQFVELWPFGARWPPPDAWLCGLLQTCQVKAGSPQTSLVHPSRHLLDQDTGLASTSGFFAVGMCPYRTALQKPVCEAEKCAAKWFRSRKVRFAATKLRDCRSKTATWK